MNSGKDNNSNIKGFLEKGSDSVELIIVGDEEIAKSKSSFGGARKLLAAMAITIASVATMNVTNVEMSDAASLASSAYAQTEAYLTESPLKSKAMPVYEGLTDQKLTSKIKSINEVNDSHIAKSENSFNALNLKKKAIETKSKSENSEGLQKTKPAENITDYALKTAQGLEKSKDSIYGKILQSETIDSLGPSNSELKFFIKKYLDSVSVIEFSFPENNSDLSFSGKDFEKISKALDIISDDKSQLIIEYSGDVLHQGSISSGFSGEQSEEFFDAISGYQEHLKSAIDLSSSEDISSFNFSSVENFLEDLHKQTVLNTTDDTNDIDFGM